MFKSEGNKSQNIHDPITTVYQDILERQILAQTILKQINQSDSGVIGIYGGWGTGKTSLLELMRELNMTESSLPNMKNIHIEIIDAWKYEGTGNLLIPIIAKLRELSGVKELIQCWKVMTKRVVALTGLSLIEAALKPAVSIGVTDMDVLYEMIKNKEDKNYETVLLDWERVVDDMSNEQEAFETIVGLANKAQKCDRLILCIDNLDRCAPDKVIALLESIKLFLSVPNCTWVFAMDAEVVASYINHKYEGTKMDGNSYLDKIIPEQYHLSLSPTLDRKRIVKLLRHLVRNNAFEINENDIPQIPRVLVPRRLIKSAAKVLDFNKLPDRNKMSVPQTLVFYLALLYHVWPDFYQRFSSSSETHIRSILDNFFLPETPAQTASEPLPLIKTNLLPLLKDYAEDQDLAYYMKTVFSGYDEQRRRNIFLDEIISGISGLRKTGLP